MSRRSTVSVAESGSGNVSLPTLEEVDFEGSSSITPGDLRNSSSSLRQGAAGSSSTLQQPLSPALKSYTRPLSGGGSPRSSSSSGLISRFGRFGSTGPGTTSSRNDGNISQRRSSWIKSNSTRLALARVYRGYSIGDYALVMSKRKKPPIWVVDDDRGGIPSISDDLESNESDDTELYLLNKYGFPDGEGNYPFERKGPYLYVLCTIKQVHYEENEVFWTVMREDNGQDMRGDAGFMAPIHTDEGLNAAQKAAAFSRAIAISSYPNEDIDGDWERDQNQTGKKRSIFSCMLNCCCMCCCFPFYCFYQCLRRIKQTEAYAGMLRHAKNVLDGVYMISFRITSVNVIAFFLLWYLFIDDIKLAFLAPSVDETLAYLNLVVWIVLVLELVFETFARPEGWYDLVRSDKAYTPHTARFISGVHLFVESISLLLFVPVFHCVFTGQHTCSSRTSFSFFEARLIAVSGRVSQAFVWRLLQGIQRWRVFGLVRLWRNAWINRAFKKDENPIELEKRRRKELLRNTSNDDDSMSTIDDDDGDGDTVGEYGGKRLKRDGLVPHGDFNYNYSNDQHRQQQQQLSATKTKKDNESSESMIKATNIGTALMTVNSYRALFLFCLLSSCFPMLFLLNDTWVVDSAGSEMVEYLQAINLQDADNYTGEDDSVDCDYFFESVEAWVNTLNNQFDEQKKLLTYPLISISIRPPRCYDRFNGNDSVIGDLKFHVGDNCPSWNWPEEGYNGPCIQGEHYNITQEASSLLDVAKDLNLRVGSLNTFETSLKPSNFTFAISATSNYDEFSRAGAFRSFFLQLLLFVTIIWMLVQLRSDMVELALGSLRSMLRIIARYASNPLAPAGNNEVYHRQGTKSIASSDTGSSGDEDTEEEDNQVLRSYETEQLVSAVTKITGLLRKCWGVAGANIISTNLASRDGDIEVFNPTVPGKNVFALFAFATITDFDHALKGLEGDVMILINDVASVLHNEVFRWGLGDSGQCNRNLGSSFIMVFKIGSVMDVVERLEEATRVIFSTGYGKSSTSQKQRRIIDRRRPKFSTSAQLPNAVKGLTTDLYAEKDVAMEAMAQARQLSLERIPGISTFADRAVIGMLKSFAGINRDTALRAWSQDFRLKKDGGLNSSITDESDKISSGIPWPVNMIFGMDAGWAVEGAVGSKYKIDATYLSPHMNMAARMMSACKHYGVTILLSQDVRDLLSEPAKTKMRNLDRVTVKGSSKIQNIYTYDAQAKGADFFLYSESDEQADQRAKNYDPSIWDKDPDLRAMRNHISEDFEQEFNAGMKAYYDGDWDLAIKKLEEANNIMVEAAIDEEDLYYELNNSPERKELYRKTASDPPSMYLINFMKSYGGKAPDDWDGWHPLLSK